MSKILTTLRLSGAVWIEAWRLAPSCPRTCAPISDPIRFHVIASSSLAPFSVYRLFIILSTSLFSLSWPEPVSSRSSSLIAVATRREREHGRPMKPGCCEIAAAQNLKDQPAICPSQYWLARISPRVLQWGCSLRDSLQRVEGLLASPHPTNRLFNSLAGGHLSHLKSSTAHKQLFESIKLISLLQARVQCF